MKTPVLALLVWTALLPKTLLAQDYDCESLYRDLSSVHPQIQESIVDLKSWIKNYFSLSFNLEYTGLKLESYIPVKENLYTIPLETYIENINFPLYLQGESPISSNQLFQINPSTGRYSVMRGNRPLDIPLADYQSDAQEFAEQMMKTNRSAQADSGINIASAQKNFLMGLTTLITTVTKQVSKGIGARLLSTLHAFRQHYLSYTSLGRLNPNALFRVEQYRGESLFVYAEDLIKKIDTLTHSTLPKPDLSETRYFRHLLTDYYNLLSEYLHMIATNWGTGSPIPEEVRLHMGTLSTEIKELEKKLSKTFREMIRFLKNYAGIINQTDYEQGGLLAKIIERNQQFLLNSRMTNWIFPQSGQASDLLISIISRSHRLMLTAGRSLLWAVKILSYSPVIDTLFIQGSENFDQNCKEFNDDFLNRYGLTIYSHFALMQSVPETAKENFLNYCQELNQELNFFPINPKSTPRNCGNTQNRFRDLFTCYRLSSVIEKRIIKPITQTISSESETTDPSFLKVLGNQIDCKVSFGSLEIKKN